MVVKVSSISESGRRVKFGMNSEWAVGAASVALETEVSHLSGVVVLERQKQTVDAQVEVVVGVSEHCVRCHQEVSEQLKLDASLRFQAMPNFSVGEVELTVSDLDIGWYCDDKLDLSAVLSEVITLSWSGRYQCNDEAECELRTSTLLATSSSDDKGHPAFQALRNFR